MREREYNTDIGTIDCHYFTGGTGFICMITQVVDDNETDNLLFTGWGNTCKEAKQNAVEDTISS